MNTPSPSDAYQIKTGDKIVLLVGDYDPAHIDYLRAIDALASRSGVSQVWISPFASIDRPVHIGNMCTILANDATQATGRQIGCCTVALTKKFYFPHELRNWLQRIYPSVIFHTARIDGNWSADETAITFSGPREAVGATDHIHLRKFIAQPEDLVERIRTGQDMSRSFTASVWEYIQQFKLYRN